MINGTHILLYSKNAERLRTFFKDALGFRSVDAGQGWLIFALPPAELAMHPTGKANSFELYLMCDDVKATIERLKRKRVSCTKVTDQGWGLLTSIKLPGGGELGLYQPKHPVAIGTKRKRKKRI
jgi:catechol 2,3-dioxygenase-like lactoylglutathione lyase family enzyme